MSTKKGDSCPRVTVVRDHGVTFQDLWMNVHIPRYNAGMAEMFARFRCWNAKTLDSADLVVFTGGPDVNPQLYGEKPHPKTMVSEQRDEEDLKTYAYCLEKGIPMLGVCRGAQFLHVMNGGKLYQHVNGHLGVHSIRDARSKEIIERVSSTHHQMVMPQKDMMILATADVSTERWRNDKDREGGEFAKPITPDIEAFFYRDTCCLGIQGHPEFRGYPEFTSWVSTIIYDLIGLNPDLAYDDSLKPSALRIKERKESFKVVEK